ncbi:MAG: ATP-binding cassette domain-containing protein, partial [Oxalobacteraceae bacterium]
MSPTPRCGRDSTPGEWRYASANSGHHSQAFSSYDQRRMIGVYPLRVEGLRVRYGSHEVLRGLSLTIDRAQIYGLLGPNGAGKTTLIRSICGRVRPDAGTVSISGTSGKQSLRHIGLVPQELALYSHLTARENLQVFGRLSGLSAGATRSAIDWAG